MKPGSSGICISGCCSALLQIWMMCAFAVKWIKHFFCLAGDCCWNSCGYWKVHWTLFTV